MKTLLITQDQSVFKSDSGLRMFLRSCAVAFGDDLHVAAVGPAGAHEEQDGMLFLHPVRSSRLFQTRLIAERAHSLILSHGIQIVSAQDPFETGLAAQRAVQGTQAKLYIQVQTDFLSPWFLRSGNWRSPTVRMPFLNRWRIGIADTVLPAADGIRAVSERIKASLMKRYGSRIVAPSVIPMAVDPAVPVPALLPARGFTFSFITVGKLEPQERIEDILAALKLVVPRYPTVGLIIVGDGPERSRLERMAKSLGIADNVVFAGDRPDARALMASAQAFVQASAYEGYGRALVEAALAKVPIITTDVGIVGEVFRGYEEVLAVPVADPTALSLAIVGLIEDNAVRQELPIHAEAAARAHLAAVGDNPARIAEDLNRLVTRD